MKMNLVPGKLCMRMFACLALIIGTCTGCMSDSGRDFALRRKALGRTEKFRVMVDKVAMLDNTDHRMTEKHVQQYAEAGFNVVVPRNGADDYGYVRKMAKFAGKHKVFYMPWIRGGLYTPDDRRSDIPAIPEKKKIVSYQGVVQTKYSPNSEELWEWFTERVLTYAKISLEEAAMIGVFVDYENYSQPRGPEPERKKLIGDLYRISFDQDIIDKFAKSRKIEIPKLLPKHRHSWLIENKLLDAFRDFQFQQWRIRARKLRKAVDAINPRFQFCVYPFKSDFIQQAAWREFSTKQAPVIIGDHRTYGRPKNLSQIDGLKKHERWIRKKRKFVEDFQRQHNVSLLLLGGIDPMLYQSPDHEFAGRNAVVISENCSGYWVFYELDKSATNAEHKGYVEWFSRANQAISQGQYDFWRKERQTPDPIAPNVPNRP